MVLSVTSRILKFRQSLLFLLRPAFVAVVVCDPPFAGTLITTALPLLAINLLWPKYGKNFR
jgi:hypothetical protein